MPTIFEIPESNLKTLRRRVERYVTRAKKHGFAEIEFSLLEIEERPIAIADHFARLRGDYDATRTVRERIAKVQLNDVKSMFGDWTIIGSRQNVRANGRIEAYTFGEVSPELAGSDVCCDHCKTKRNRSLVYIARHLDGHDVQVGSTCLSDFVGSDVPAGLAEGLQIHSRIAREISEASSPYWRDGSPGEVTEESMLVMAVANRIIQDRGWVSSATSRDLGFTATWQSVGHALELSRTKDGAGLESMAPLASDFMAAEDAAAWIRGETDNNFLRDVALSIARGACGAKEIALLSAGMAAYRSHLSRKVEIEELREKAVTAEHVGTIGQRIELIVSVRKMKPFLSDFGGGMIVSMMSADGDFLTWITGSVKGLKVGKAFEIKGTVKQHQTAQYGPLKGTKETILSRVSVLAELDHALASGSAVEGDIPEQTLDSIDDYFSSGPTL
jgi:hypothetical protein